MFKARDKKEIGRTGEYVSSLGLGTFGIQDYNRAFEAFTYAYEMGIDNIDTAEMYGNGRAEEFIGRFIKTVGKENIFITTKIMPHNMLPRDRAERSARNSLKRLGISTVDLILLHWSEPYLSLEEQIKNLEYLANKGYTRYIGVSNLNIDELELAINTVSKYDIVVNQVRYSVYDRRIEKKLLPYCIEKGITIQAYTPLERGEVVKDNILKEVGKKYGKTEVQVALNYLISQINVIPIPKTERRERIEEYIGSLGWRLKKEDIEYIRRKILSRYSIDDLEDEQ
ncbi:TPA: aldo/keto reductase [Candidatus Geothermarchaeota archaeon]|nr:aldo/keto reductase [Candidatus Geothermarchaeota archaeon]